MHDTAKAQIARITDLSQAARAGWISLLAFLCFVGVTLLAVQDADFFVPSRETALPLIAVRIPTASFFWLAPLLAAALYINLHLHLLKLWDAVAEAPAQIDGAPIGDFLHSWFGTDLALDLKGGAAIRTHPMLWLSHLVARLLIWIAGPAIVAGFWWRSAPAHDPWLSLTIAFALVAMLYCGLTSHWHAIKRLRRPWDRGWSGRGNRLAAAGFTVALVAATWSLTERDIEIDASTPVIGGMIADLTGNQGFGTLTEANLAEVELVSLPPGWRPIDAARLAYRDSWCKQEALPAEICDRPPTPDRPIPARIGALRAEWCAETGQTGDCAARFAGYDAQFEAAWLRDRAANRDGLGGLDLSGRDLRGATAQRASLVGASLADARLNHADLRDAQMEGADLRRADLSDALLRGAGLPAANLTGAQLNRADLREARLDQAMLPDADLRRANLAGARLDGAYLLNARLDRANLTGARFDSANLTVAMLDGADLRSAGLTGADLRWSDLRSARWSGAILDAAPALYADLRGTEDLTQAQLDRLVGNAGTLLPDHPAPDTGLPYTIPSCWSAPPAGFEALLARLADGSAGAAADLRAGLICAAGTAPDATGTPCARDIPRAKCLPPAP